MKTYQADRRSVRDDALQLVLSVTGVQPARDVLLVVEAGKANDLMVLATLVTVASAFFSPFSSQSTMTTTSRSFSASAAESLQV